MRLLVLASLLATVSAASIEPADRIVPEADPHAIDTTTGTIGTTSDTIDTTSDTIHTTSDTIDTTTDTTDTTDTIESTCNFESDPKYCSAIRQKVLDMQCPEQQHALTGYCVQGDTGDECRATCDEECYPNWSSVACYGGGPESNSPTNALTNAPTDAPIVPEADPHSPICNFESDPKYCSAIHEKVLDTACEEQEDVIERDCMVQAENCRATCNYQCYPPCSGRESGSADSPTLKPTDAPTNAPTGTPTNAPTDAPTDRSEERV